MIKQEKRSVKDTKRPEEYFIAIFSEHLKYKCITKRQHKEVINFQMKQRFRFSDKLMVDKAITERE